MRQTALDSYSSVLYIYLLIASSVCVCGGGGEEVILLDVEGQTEMPEQVQFHVLSAWSFTLLSKVVTFCQEVQSNIAFLA